MAQEHRLAYLNDSRNWTTLGPRDTAASGRGGSDRQLGTLAMSQWCLFTGDGACDIHDWWVVAAQDGDEDARVHVVYPLASRHLVLGVASWSHPEHGSDYDLVVGDVPWLVYLVGPN